MAVQVFAILGLQLRIDLQATTTTESGGVGQNLRGTAPAYPAERVRMDEALETRRGDRDGQRPRDGWHERQRERESERKCVRNQRWRDCGRACMRVRVRASVVRGVLLAAGVTSMFCSHAEQINPKVLISSGIVVTAS